MFIQFIVIIIHYTNYYGNNITLITLHYTNYYGNNTLQEYMYF